jgi:EAL domain-containing protein (putative c-di-GMP-specific phosphodiesterase class I)/GGDEF domain-containing protein
MRSTNSLTPPKKSSSGISLKTQLYGLVLFLGLMSFVGRLLVSVDHTRDYLNEQMSIHAQDAATSLGLSISPYLDEESIVIAETMMAAIFDSGYYASMVLISPENKNLLSMSNPKLVEGVPTWFIDLFPLDPPTRETEVSSGWNIAGTLYVTSHAGVSYSQLWDYSIRAFYGSIVILLACLLIAHFIIRAVLKPLQKVEEQAYAITNKEFIINDNIPLTKELRAVTAAINGMVKNVQKTFVSMTDHAESLAQEAYIDKLTQVGNRRAFDNQLHSHFVDSDALESSIALITMPSLLNVNTELGFKDGDEYVLKVIKTIQEELALINGVQYYRISGGCFIVTLPLSLNLAIKDFENVNKKLNAFNSHRYSNGFAKLVMCAYTEDDNMSDLLSRLDTLSTQSKGQVIAPDLLNKHKTASLGLQQWKSLINDIINKGNIDFSFQPITYKNNTTPLYIELFSNFSHKEQNINNGQLFAMAERLNLTTELDKKLVMSVSDLKNRFPDQVFAINLSNQSIHDVDFTTWLDNYIQLNQNVFENMIIEINESSLLNDVITAKEIINLLKHHNIKVCIERFGSSLSSFKYLRGLNVDYVKLDGSYIRDLINNPDNNYFIQAVTQICQGLGITVIACHIENEATFEKINELSINAYQGNYLQVPQKVTFDHTKTDSPEAFFALKSLNHPI